MTTPGRPLSISGYRIIGAEMTYQISEQLADGRRYVHDLHSLLLPSGCYCHQLNREDLHKELVALKIPGVENFMGHQQLSVLFSRWVKDQAPKP
jgi:hypothetical protein